MSSPLRVACMVIAMVLFSSFAGAEGIPVYANDSVGVGVVVDKNRGSIGVLFTFQWAAITSKFKREKRSVRGKISCKNVTKKTERAYLREVAFVAPLR